MSWIIPYNKLNKSSRTILERADLLNDNLCIVGSVNTEKKSVLLFYLLRRIKNTNPSATVLFIVLTNIQVELFEHRFRELGLNVDVTTYYSYSLSRNSQQYDYIFCDDIQNTIVSVLTTIKEHAKHVVVTFDPYLTVFEKSLHSNDSFITIESITEVLSAKVYNLEMNHPPFVQDILSKLIPGIGFTHIHYTGFHPDTYSIHLCKAIEETDEIKYINNDTVKSLSVGKTVGVLLPTSRDILMLIRSLLEIEGKPTFKASYDNYGRIDFKKLNTFLADYSVPIQCLGNNFSSLSEMSNKINVMTYHNSIGLEFDNVIMPFLNNRLFISMNDKIARHLFVLALTRFRNDLFLTYSGSRHEYLNAIESYCSVIDIHDALYNSIPSDSFLGF